MFEEFGEFGKFDASRSRGVRTEKKAFGSKRKRLSARI